MLVSSFNVNSIKARTNHLVNYLKKYSIDILLLQELKSVEDNFPYKIFENLGYYIMTNCQKSYNGVGILSKFEIKKPKYKFYEDIQARFLEVQILDYTVVCVYVPNGNPINSEKYGYKLDWLENFYFYCKSLIETNKNVIIGGDFNVIQKDKDCYNIEDWSNDALYKIEVRKKLRKILNLGFFDTYRLLNGEQKKYSFWDYQGGAWQKDNGIRIDLILTTSEIIDKIKNAGIHREIRGQEKPSDHTPVWIDLP